MFYRRAHHTSGKRDKQKYSPQINNEKTEKKIPNDETQIKYKRKQITCRRQRGEREKENASQSKGKCRDLFYLLLVVYK